MTYSEKLNILVKNTIEQYSSSLEVITYAKYYDRIAYYNKKYKNKVDLFFTDNNIEQNNFFSGLGKIQVLEMLKKLESNTTNILYNFQKHFVTEKLLDERLYNKYSESKVLDTKTIDNIRYFLFNNSNSNDMLTLEEQNAVLKDYHQIDVSMKKIKVVE